jgi:Tfp pilus assembly protein PilF
MDDNRLKALKAALENDPEDSFSRYALGLEYLSASMFEESRAGFEELITRDPNYLAAYYQLGKVYESSGEFDLARRIYEKGIYVAASQNEMHTKTELEEALDGLL